MIDRVLVQCRTRGAIKHIWCGDRADGGGDRPACRPPPLFFSFRANNNNLSAATGNNNGRRARARARGKSLYGFYWILAVRPITHRETGFSQQASIRSAIPCPPLPNHKINPSIHSGGRHQQA